MKIVILLKWLCTKMYKGGGAPKSVLLDRLHTELLYVHGFDLIKVLKYFPKPFSNLTSSSHNVVF